MKSPQFDVAVSGGGTVYLFHLVSQKAREWVDDNVSDDRQMFGNAVAVEHCYAAALATGMHRDRLVVGDQEDL